MAKNKKDNLKVKYDAVSDALALVLKEGKEDYFEELAPGLSVEFDRRGKVIGFEILGASKYLRKAIFPLSRKAKGLVSVAR